MQQIIPLYVQPQKTQAGALGSTLLMHRIKKTRLSHILHHHRQLHLQDPLQKDQRSHRASHHLSRFIERLKIYPRPILKGALVYKLQRIKE